MYSYLFVCVTKVISEWQNFVAFWHHDDEEKCDFTSLQQKGTSFLDIFQHKI